ncbi:MAG: hypothetical protein EKK29_05815 [Hyphomicrobiales bacterium]|nr:MAG: hypothetical protein EKK29_05815 [Hyphomicrobiales bacterium]
MGFFERFLPNAVKSPEELATIVDCNSALIALRNERVENDAERAQITDRRQAALEADESDAALGKIDDQLDRSFLSSERLDVLERRILDRLATLQDDARREQLTLLEGEMRRVENELDAAMGAAAEVFDRYLTLAGQFDQCGFSEVARSIFAVPPMISGGLVCGKEPLEIWRRERERISDMRARSAAGQPLKLGHPALPIAPVRPAPNPPERAVMQDPSYRPGPSRAPQKVAERPSYGFSKIVFLRSGVELDGNLHVVGDEVIVGSDKANDLMRTGAADLIERGLHDAEVAQ